MNKRGMDFNQIMMLVLALAALIVGIMLFSDWGKNILNAVTGIFG